MRLRRIILSVACLASVFSVSGAQPLFRSDRLEKMADVLGRDRIMALGNGAHYAGLSYAGYPVTVIIRDGTVEHIGYSFFTGETRAAAGSVVSSFLERYALEADLPVERETDVLTQQLEDGVFFGKGNLSSLKTFCRDTAAAFTVDLLGARRYRFAWPDGDMLFPVDYQLLIGRDQLENERRLPEEIRSCETVRYPADVAGDSFYLDNLVSRFYYDKNGKVIDSPSMPAETLANILGGAADAGDLAALVKMNVYGLKFQYFEVPLKNLVAYAVETGCTPYCAPVRQDDETIECSWILRQVEAGYAHALRLWIPKDCLRNKTGKVQVRLTPFIPMYSLRYLFEETRQ